MGDLPIPLQTLRTTHPASLVAYPHCNLQRRCDETGDGSHAMTDAHTSVIDEPARYRLERSLYAEDTDGFLAGAPDAVLWRMGGRHPVRGGTGSARRVG